MLFHIFIRDPRNGRKANSRVARPQSVEGLGMAGPFETLGSPWLQLNLIKTMLRGLNKKIILLKHFIVQTLLHLVT
jgi:hypothetical protein